MNLPPTLKFDITDRIGVVTFDRPDKLNALNEAMWEGLDAITDHAAGADPEDLRALVFTGSGPGFSVGGDFDEFEALTGPADRRRYIDRVFGAYRAIEELPVATIAAVHGHALGGGCELTLVCDVVVAAGTATFGMPEIGFGLFPGIGVSRGREQLSQHWLRYLVLLGEPIPADEARLAGLVNRVVPDGEHLSTALEMARTIAARAPLAVRAAKRELTKGSAAGYDGPHRAVPELMGTNDHAEGIAAFRERRAPEFDGS
jgi:enoyl-CoA hydratase/carnithine racemase